MTDLEALPQRREGSASEVFRVFLLLGLTSFGGPVAHLGYFQDALVRRRRWLSEAAYADLVALCQFLPGPASSQVGMAIGLHRAGFRGLLAAWAGFTLPSALLMLLFAFGVSSFADTLGSGWLLGLKAAVVAVVVQAVLSMARTLTPDARRATLAVLAMVVVLLVPGALTQVGAIVLTGMLGYLWLGSVELTAPTLGGVRARIPLGVAIAALTAFVLLLLVLPLLAATTTNGAAVLFDVFYRAGSLVFGGGHVVLPLLEAELVSAGLVDGDLFLAGYGAAQAVPGPLFTFAAYLGALNEGDPTGLLGGVIALLGIFLPAALVLVGVLPFWERLRRNRSAQRIAAGVNAGVVGILAAALYSPVFIDGVVGPLTLCFAVVAYAGLAIWRLPAWLIVLVAACAGWLLL